MPHYKDNEGKLHFLDDASFERYLTAGCVPITDAEAATIEAANEVAVVPVRRREAILRQLADIDARSIRPVAEGDAAYLATLRAPVAALRAELKLL